MKKILIYLTFAAQLTSFKLDASTACLDFFAADAEDKNRVEDLIAYFGNLLEQQIIDEPGLQRLVSGLEVGDLINPITEERSRVNSTALLHREEIQEYFDTTYLDQDSLLNWAKQELSKMQGVHESRKLVRVETKDPHQKMEFLPIPPGKFQMGERDPVSVELTHHIEMMSTLVTQKHWMELMGKNPSAFVDLNNPVETVTWWSAATFANKLSKAHGLEPAYDFGGIKFHGNAEDGTLMITTGKLKIKAHRGNIYLAEGYRLPTEAEQEYVRKFDNGTMELKEHAWFMDNADGRPHSVGELNPWVINGHKFFDLFGNVYEWSNDRYVAQGDLKGGKDPRASIVRSMYPEIRVVRGGYWDSTESSCKPSARFKILEGNDSSAGIGFRLVRTIK